MPFSLANWVKPPELESACKTVMPGRRGRAPDLTTSPVTKTRRLLICVTVTVTCGFVRYLVRPSRILPASCMAVSPAACTSFKRGKEILPSGRTGMVLVISGSFQTSICNTSCGPILYSASSVCLAASSAVFGTVADGEFGALFNGFWAKSEEATSNPPHNNAPCFLIVRPLIYAFRPRSSNLLELVKQSLVADL